MKLTYRDQAENIGCKQNQRISLELPGQIFKKISLQKVRAETYGQGSGSVITVTTSIRAMNVQKEVPEGH